MNNFGPQYCETPGVVTGAFPVEPANAVSSGIIVLFGILALVQVARRTPQSIEFYALCALLIVNGLGSMLWHGLRTRWALTLDVTPALIFLLLALIAWARRVASLWEIGAVVVGLFALDHVMRNVDFSLRLPGRWGAMAPLVVAAALWLIARSHALSRTATIAGGLALISASAALAFRTIDNSVCASVPMGTHFLWHVLLSAAAFLCVLALIALETARPRAEQPVAQSQ
jgi:hypothetical protein